MSARCEWLDAAQASTEVVTTSYGQPHIEAAIDEALASSYVLPDVVPVLRVTSVVVFQSPAAFAS